MPTADVAGVVGWPNTMASWCGRARTSPGRRSALWGCQPQLREQAEAANPLRKQCPTPLDHREVGHTGGCRPGLRQPAPPPVARRHQRARARPRAGPVTWRRIR